MPPRSCGIHCNCSKFKLRSHYAPIRTCSASFSQPWPGCLPGAAPSRHMPVIDSPPDPIRRPHRTHVTYVERHEPERDGSNESDGGSSCRERTIFHLGDESKQTSTRKTLALRHVPPRGPRFKSFIFSTGEQQMSMTSDRSRKFASRHTTRLPVWAILASKVAHLGSSFARLPLRRR